MNAIDFTQVEVAILQHMDSFKLINALELIERTGLTPAELYPAIAELEHRGVVVHLYVGVKSMYRLSRNWAWGKFIS